jgi:hypothetical protein
LDSAVDEYDARQALQQLFCRSYACLPWSDAFGGPLRRAPQLPLPQVWHKISLDPQDEQVRPIPYQTIDLQVTFEVFLIEDRRARW